MPTGVYERTKYHKDILEKSRIKAVVISANLRRGKAYSEERKIVHKIAMSKFKGKKRPKEIGIKISLALTGRKLSLEHRNNISKVQKGKSKPPRTKEHIENNAKHSRGINSHWWKGGRTELKKQIKNLSLYKEWREAVFERDNYTCQFCGKRGGIELAPDHIKPFYLILDENKITTQEQAKKCKELWEISNGRTLCHPCHKTTDTFGWNIYNAKRTKTIL